jgi:two-component system, OmpR family, KDP operon response regulator KdpE
VARVLVVDDDRSLLRALRVGLRAHHHEVDLAVSAEEGLAKAVEHPPDVVVLDLGLPDLDGLEVVRRIRQWSDVPIIVLSANESEPRKVSALDGGADDYVTKPFGMAELEARIRMSIRHRAPAPGDDAPGSLVVGDLELDLVHHEAERSGTALHLTAKEFDLLAFLARHAGKVCTHQMILRDVWGDEYGDESQYLRVYIYRLRRKLGDEDGGRLRTVPGIGYSLGAG